MNEKLHINKFPQNVKISECKTISTRIRHKTVEQLDKISQETNRSRNEIINIMLEYGIENAGIIEK